MQNLYIFLVYFIWLEGRRIIDKFFFLKCTRKFIPVPSVVDIRLFVEHFCLFLGCMKNSTY